MREATENLQRPKRKTENRWVWVGHTNCGFFYRDEKKEKEFAAHEVTHEINLCSPFKRDDGSHYCGLLDREGYPLKIGEPVIVLWFKIKKIEY